MLKAKRNSTHQQYNSYLKLWFDFCATRNKHPFTSDVPFAIGFLEHLRNDKRLSYSALNTARSALSSIILPSDNIPFGQHQLVKIYMRGAFNLDPPQPRYQHTWDPQTILTLIRRWNPPATVTFKLLTFKVVILVLLVTGQRLQTVSLLSLDNMIVDTKNQKIIFKIPQLLKQSRPGYKNPIVELNAFDKDVDLCIYRYLLEYIARTSSLRHNNSLFISFQKPFKPVTKSTLGRWVKTVMSLAKIDTNIYKPHSIRSASTSAALRGGAPVEDILAAAGWSSDNVFARFYNRPVCHNNVFDVAVLDNTVS